MFSTFLFLLKVWCAVSPFVEPMFSGVRSILRVVEFVNKFTPAIFTWFTFTQLNHFSFQGFISGLNPISFNHIVRKMIFRYAFLNKIFTVFVGMTFGEHIFIETTSKLTICLWIRKKNFNLQWLKIGLWNYYHWCLLWLKMEAKLTRRMKVRM